MSRLDDSLIDFVLFHLGSSVADNEMGQGADLANLDHAHAVRDLDQKFEVETTSILNKEHSTWRLWLQQALAKIDVPRESRIRTHLLSLVLANNEARESACRSFCENHSASVSDIFKNDSSLFRTLFETDPSAQKAWFDQFRKEGPRLGARAIEQYALANRGTVWSSLLKWKQGSSGFAPIVAAHQRWRWHDELDVSRTVEAFRESERGFWQSPQWHSSLRDGQLIAVAYDYFASALARLLYNGMNSGSDWDGERQRRYVSAYDQVAAYFATAMWPDLTRHLLSLSSTALLSLSHSIVDATELSAAKQDPTQGDASLSETLREVVLLKIKWSSATRLLLAVGLSHNLTSFVTALVSGDHADRAQIFDQALREYASALHGSKESAEASFKVCVRECREEKDLEGLVMVYLWRIFVIDYCMTRRGYDRVTVEAVLANNSLEWAPVADNKGDRAVVPLARDTLETSLAQDQDQDADLVDPLVSMHDMDKKRKRSHRHRGSSASHTPDKRRRRSSSHRRTSSSRRHRDRADQDDVGDRCAGWRIPAISDKVLTRQQLPIELVHWLSREYAKGCLL